MRKLRIALPLVTFLYLFIGAFFFTSIFSADESGYIPKPMILGYGMYALLDESPVYTIDLYNPPTNYDQYPDNFDAWTYENICSVETSLTFPKDIIEVQSVDFAIDSDNNYSNETGVINFKSSLGGCKKDMFFSLFNITFKAKQLGQGYIHISKSVIIGGNDGGTTIPSDVSLDAQVEIVPIDTYDPNWESEDPLENIPIDIPAKITQPKVQTKSSSGTSSSSSATAKTVAKTENKDFKTPVLTKLEFGPNAVLDKPNAKSQGAVFSGTAEPNSKVYLLLHSQAEIYTDVTTGADGTWTKTIDSWLEDGGHTISVWSEKDNKISPKLNTKFVISSYAKDQIAIGDTYPEYKGADIADPGLKTKKESKLNTLMKNKYFWVYIGGGLLLIAICIILIIKSRRKKNDSDDENFTGDGGFINQSAMPLKSSGSQESNDSIYPNTPI